MIRDTIFAALLGLLLYQNYKIGVERQHIATMVQILQTAIEDQVYDEPDAPNIPREEAIRNLKHPYEQ